MRKHKNKIISAVVILAVLAGAWFYGGNYGKGKSEDQQARVADSAETPLTSGDNVNAAVSPTPGTASPNTAQESQAPVSPVATSIGSLPTQTSTDGNGDDDTLILNSENPPETSPQSPAESTSPVTPDSTPTMEIDPETGKDRYNTEAVPSGRPLPVEPQDVTAGDGSFTVTLTVRCDTILDNMNLLNREKHELVPDDGVIFPVTTVTAYEGESVFNVLQREMRRARIHMTFRNTPIYNSAYIEAINNLYEFDVGELSGWMYRVNGWYPNYGCSRYQLSPGDVIEWRYTCDLGRDLEGGGWLASGGQREE